MLFSHQYRHPLQGRIYESLNEQSVVPIVRLEAADVHQARPRPQGCPLSHLRSIHLTTLSLLLFHAMQGDDGKPALTEAAVDRLAANSLAGEVSGACSVNLPTHSQP